MAFGSGGVRCIYVETLGWARGVNVMEYATVAFLCSSRVRLVLVIGLRMPK